MKIMTDNLWLRPIKEEDKDKLREWRNASRESFFDEKEITVEGQDRWYTKYASLPPGTDMMFIATKITTGEEVGTIALYDVNIDNRTALLGRVLIRERYRGHNYAQEMVNGIRDFAFNTIRLHKLVDETDLLNTTAQKIYFAAGFKTIGQRFILVTPYLFRIVVILELINPNHDLKRPLRLVEVD